MSEQIPDAAVAVSPLIGYIVDLGSAGIIAAVFFWAWNKAEKKSEKLIEIVFDMVRQQTKTNENVVNELRKNTETLAQSTDVNRNLSERLSVYIALNKTDKP